MRNASRKVEECWEHCCFNIKRKEMYLFLQEFLVDVTNKFYWSWKENFAISYDYGLQSCGWNESKILSRCQYGESHRGLRYCYTEVKGYKSIS